MQMSDALLSLISHTVPFDPEEFLRPVCRSDLVDRTVICAWNGLCVVSVSSWHCINRRFYSKLAEEYEASGQTPSFPDSSWS